MADYRVFGSLLLAGLCVLSGLGVFGYAILVAGQLLLGFLGLLACLGIAAFLLASGR